MKEVIFIKYGGSIITDKSCPMSVLENVIKTLNKQVQFLSLETSFSIILGNGGGAFGHYFADKYQLFSGKIETDTFLGICKGKDGNSYLNRLVVEDLLNLGISACSVRISVPYILQNNAKSWEEVFLYLDNDIIPIIYGDIVLLSKIQYDIISTEHAFVDLAKYMCEYKKEQYHINKIIFCTNTDGVLDKNGEKIPKITADFNDSSIFWHDNKNYDVTGGMLEKVEKSLKMASIAPVQIVNGRQENAIIKAVNGESIGTIICNK